MQVLVRALAAMSFGSPGAAGLLGPVCGDACPPEGLPSHRQGTTVLLWPALRTLAGPGGATDRLSALLRSCDSAMTEEHLIRSFASCTSPARGRSHLGPSVFLPCHCLLIAGHEDWELGCG